MIKYFCSSSRKNLKNMTWEDFLPVDGNHIKVTVQIGTTPEIEVREGADWDWVDTYVPIFTENNLKTAIAKANNVTMEEISIDWRGTAQAV